MKRITFFLMSMLFITSLSFSQSEVRVDGGLHSNGGLQQKWIDVAGTNYTLTPKVDYGIVMADNGVKNVTLPIITADLRGMVFEISNESESGIINLVTTQTIDGFDKVQTGRTMLITAKTPTKWVSLLY